MVTELSICGSCFTISSQALVVYLMSPIVACGVFSNIRLVHTYKLGLLQLHNYQEMFRLSMFSIYSL